MHCRLQACFRPVAVAVLSNEQGLRGVAARVMQFCAASKA